MRRLWVVVAGLVAVASVTVGSGVAAARVETQRSATSCSTLIKNYQKTSNAASGINLSNPKSFQTAFKTAAKEIRSLASNGPSSLRPAFRHLASAYDQFAKLNFTNPAALTQLTQFSTTYAADLAKIAQYFGKQCNFTIPTTPTVPGTP
jgi:membrane-bound lytic murein transglycosylase B